MSADRTEDGLRVVHEPAQGSVETLATSVSIADSMLSKGIGLMGRAALPDGFALVLEVGDGLFGGPAKQGVHMFLVRTPLDVVWLVDDEVTNVDQLSPWWGRGAGTADRIIEFPAGAAATVEVGDTVRLEESDTAGE